MSTALRVTGIQKSFASNRVLHGIDFDLAAGEVTVLMGANGAGKSTLVKILSGVHAHDNGLMSLFGEPFAPATPSDAMEKGVVTVHQSINEGVVPDLDIASNLLLETLASGASGFWLNRSAMRSKAAELAKTVGLHASPDTPVHELSLADRQLVSIARAMAYEPRVLILDEPTSSLSAMEADRLFDLIDSLRAQDVAILYISHRMSDIKRLADRIVSMRDGKISGVFKDAPLNLSEAVNAMLGRVVDETIISANTGQVPAISLLGITLTPGTRPFDLTVTEGEVVAITGLVGSGKSALANVLFGLAQPVTGSMQLGQQDYRPRTPGDAIAAGVFLCPRDRTSNAIVPDFNLAHNLTLPFLRKYSRFSWLNQSSEQTHSESVIQQLSVVCQSAEDNIGTLSGGNQQKIVVGRWLAEPSNVLILDEPFQGVDIQARRDIGEQLRNSAEHRATIVLVSELDEALEVADRILVLAEHTLVGEHFNHDVDMDRLLAEVASANKVMASEVTGHHSHA